MTTRLGTRAIVTIAPLTIPQASPMPSPTSKTTTDRDVRVVLEEHAGGVGGQAEDEPTERSTLRVTITIVSPIASRPMIAAPRQICCRLVALTKLGLLIAVTATTITSASTIPSSRKRNTSSANECELAASGSAGGRGRGARA